MPIKQLLFRTPLRAYLRGSPDTRRNRRLIRYIDRAIGPGVRALCSTTRSDFKELLEDQIAAGGGTAIVCGGDGTAHFAAQVIAGTSTALLPLPGGTANDLSRELGWYPVQTSRARVKYQTIDCVRVNDWLMITVGGLGRGAEVIRAVQSAKSRNAWRHGPPISFGKWIYTICAAAVSFRASNRCHEYSVATKTDFWRGQTGSVFVCNQGILAGTFNVCNTSNNADGMFEIIVGSNRTPIRSIADGLSSILTRTALADGASHVFSTERAVITTGADGSGGFFADGELLPCPSDGRFHLSIERNILTIARRL